MPVHKGPMPPAQPRTLRSIALARGTVPAGFGEVALPEDKYPGQYNDEAKAALSPPAAAVKEADPQPVPFKLGG